MTFLFISVYLNAVKSSINTVDSTKCFCTKRSSCVCDGISCRANICSGASDFPRLIFLCRHREYFVPVYSNGALTAVRPNF